MEENFSSLVISNDSLRLGVSPLKRHALPSHTGQAGQGKLRVLAESQPHGSKVIQSGRVNH